MPRCAAWLCALFCAAALLSAAHARPVAGGLADAAPAQEEWGPAAVAAAAAAQDATTAPKFGLGDAAEPGDAGLLPQPGEEAEEMSNRPEQPKAAGEPAADADADADAAPGTGHRLLAERSLLQSSGCRTIIASGLTMRNSNCRAVTTLPRGSFVDFTGGRQTDKCQAGCEWVQVRYGGSTYWAASGCGNTAYMAYCTYSFGTPSTSYDGASAPMASTTAQRWPLAQAQVSRPAVCYKSTTGTLVGIGNQPPNCAYAATHFAAPRSSGRYHNGIDLFAPAGTPVYATEPGKVALVMSNFYNGLPAVCIQHDSGKYIVYGELSPSVLKRVGDHVSTGTQIGTVGYQSGQSMLHFEVWSYQPSGGYCQSINRLCAGLTNPTKYLLAAQLIV